MTGRADRVAPTLLPSHHEHGLSGTVRDELAALRGRNLGPCARCGRSVYFEHNFSRYRGRIVHVRCPIGARNARTDAPALPMSDANGSG
jgi:hypothetical protein